MLRVRRDNGAVTGEYVALLLLVAALVAVLSASGVTPAVAAGVQRAVCLIFQVGCDGLPGGGPAAQEPLNRLGLPCMAQRNVLDVDVDALVKGVQGHASRGYVIEQVGAGTFRVTFFGDLRLGAGVKGGVDAGSLDPNWKWRTGRYGKASITAGGRGTVSYDFDSREEAEDFAQNPMQWLRMATGPARVVLEQAGGTPGRAVSRGFEWLEGKVNGVVDRITGRDSAPPVSFTSVVVNMRAEAEGGWTGGTRVGGVASADGEASGILTQIHLDGPANGWTIFSGSASGELGMGGNWLFGSGNIARGGAVRYRVIWDADGQPLRLTLVHESVSEKRSGGANLGREGRSGVGGGGYAGYGEADLSITEHNLDLRDPDNRAAFERAFIQVPGLYAQPRGLGSPTGIDQTAFLPVAERLAADGVTVRLDYHDSAPKGIVGAGGAAVTGFEASLTSLDRELTSATIVDQQWEDTAPRRWETCWSDDPAFGPPAGVGDFGGGAD